MTKKRRSGSGSGAGVGVGAGLSTSNSNSIPITEPEDMNTESLVMKNTSESTSTSDSDAGEETTSHVTVKCEHVKKALDINKTRKMYRGQHAQAQDNTTCSYCNKENADTSTSTPLLQEQLQVCLRCGAVLCSNIHAPKHMATPHSDYHALALSLDDFTVHCYLCRANVPSDYTKQLLEIVEFFKRIKPQPIESLAPIPVEAPPTLVPVPGPSTVPVSYGGSGLNKIRGLSNLGNTCFFNSVLQCLVQTPYLVEVLHEMAEAGEKFTLPGGDVTLNMPAEEPDEKPTKKEEKLPAIEGELKQWGSLTEKLANTIRELQNSVTSGVYNPRELHSVLVRKMTQFGGGDQHDSHELMRHLLEAVRSEDLKRYRQVILNKLGLATNTRPADVDDVTKQKIKFYDQQASDKMLRPEQVFRGFLVSTLECQECGHTSNRSEYFLDLSLPVVADKPQPPALSRRRGQDDTFTCLGSLEDNKPSKHQLKKEKQAAKKAARRNKFKLSDTTNDNTNNMNGPSEENNDNKSSSEHSDADCEDNVEETAKPQNGRAQRFFETAANFAAYHMESGYNSEKPISSDSIRASPVELDQKEKSDNTPERTDKDVCNITPNCLSATAIPLDYRPCSIVETPSRSNPDSGVASPETAKHNSLTDTVNPSINNKELESPVSSSSPTHSDFEPSFNAVFGKFSKVRNEPTSSDLENVSEKIKGINIDEPPQLVSPDSSFKKDFSPFNNRPYSICPRYQNDSEGYSVQSCLNQFTSSELLTGNNKVGCEACTKRVNNGKTVYTNATKRFLISSPPAILILHLKRFQFGSRYMLSKLTKHVNFSTILDLGPFCSDAAKHGPSRRNIYALYGVVEHCGGMHSGHYVAYVKVRSHVNTDDKRWSFLPTGDNTSNDSAEIVNGNDDTDSSLSGYESGEAGVGYPDIEPPPGKWYYASDSLVQEISEDKVLKAKAYLLFYERIL